MSKMAQQVNQLSLFQVMHILQVHLLFCSEQMMTLNSKVLMLLLRIKQQNQSKLKTKIEENSLQSNFQLLY